MRDITIRQKIRGIADQRNIRKSFLKNPNAPMISKNSKKDNVEISIKVPFGKNRKFTKPTFNVNQLNEQILIAKISALRKKVTASPEPNMKKLG